MIRQSVKVYAAAGVITVLALAMPLPAFAGVNIDISVPLFGLFTIERQPVVVVPGPYGYDPNRYIAPAESAVFYGGYWYRPAGGNWFIAAQAGDRHGTGSLCRSERPGADGAAAGLRQFIWHRGQPVVWQRRAWPRP
jgi:hypothetical protein